MTNTILHITPFAKQLQPQETYSPCDPAIIKKYEGVLPEVLVATWKVHGFQKFKQGFLWSVNPDQYRDTAASLLKNFSKDDLHVIFRTAFGFLIYLYQGEYYSFSLFSRIIYNKGKDLDTFLSIDMGYKELLNTTLHMDWYTKLSKKLGAPSEDEMYGLIPAAPLGGKLALENFEKVNLVAYLNILSS